jgi:hypothetical protein
MHDAVDGEKSDKRSYIRSMFWTIVLAAAGALVFLWLVVFIGSGTLAERYRARWVDAGVTKESVLARFPTADADASAIEAERLAEPLGLSLAPRTSGRGDRRRSIAERAANKEIAIGDYVNATLKRDHRAIDPPPEAVAQHLTTHAAAVEGLRNHLLTAPEPHWGIDLREPWATPVPNLLGHIEMHRLLLAETLARASAGDREGAFRTLEASWRASAFLRSHPTLIAQLIAMSITRGQVGVLRQLEAPPQVWEERLRVLDVRGPLLTAMRLEAWAKTDMDGVPSSEIRFLAKVAAPYLEYCAAELSDRERTRVDRLSSLPYLCDADPAKRGAPTEISLPPWNVLRMGGPDSLEAVLDRLARLEVDVELTRKILEADAARRADGTWPESIPGIEQSKACPHDRWLFTVEAGAATIAFHRPLRWDDEQVSDRRSRGAQTGWTLPPRFRIGP